jgi:hypothetical protein
LRELSGSAQRAWFGLRLGGSLALQAAPLASPGLTRVVAWEPVVDGAAYLARLREQHVDTLERAFSLMPKPRPRLQMVDPAAYCDEAIGFALPSPLRRQLVELRWPDAAALAAAGAVVIVADPETADGRSLLEKARAAGPQVSAMALPQHVEWMRDSADNTPLVPAQALQLLVQQISAAAGCASSRPRCSSAAKATWSACSPSPVTPRAALNWCSCSTTPASSRARARTG